LPPGFDPDLTFLSAQKSLFRSCADEKVRHAPDRGVARSTMLLAIVRNRSDSDGVAAAACDGDVAALPSPVMTSARRAILIIAGGVTLWFAVTMAVWALRPLHDNVPVGVDYTAQPARQTYQSVECNDVLSSSARDGSPLPALKQQPTTAPPLAYQRVPCAELHREARFVLWFDVAVVVLVWAAALLAWRWHPRRRSFASA
jgi:hypothetical protein